MYFGLILLGTGWYYAGYSTGFDAPMVGIIPLTTIILIVLFAGGVIMICVSLLKKQDKKIERDG